MSSFKQRRMMEKQNKNKKNSTNKLPWNLTKQYAKVHSTNVIIPFSKIYNIWSVLLILALAYNLFFVPFSIALNYEIHSWLYAVDVLSLIIFIVDMAFRSHLAIATNNKIELDHNTH